MPVEVFVPGDVSGEVKSYEHAGGSDIAVTDGHLLVLGGGTTKVAVYAPGKWLRAEVK